MDSFVDTALLLGAHLDTQGRIAWAMLVLIVWPLVAVSGLLWGRGILLGQDPTQVLAAKCLCLGMLVASTPLLALLGTAVLA